MPIRGSYPAECYSTKFVRRYSVGITHTFFILGNATEVLRIFKSQSIRDLADAFIAKAKIILGCPAAATLASIPRTSSVRILHERQAFASLFP